MPKTETADGDEVDPAQDAPAREGSARREAAAGPTEAGAAGDASRWRLSNWPLRYKLAVVLLVPLIAALVFGSLRAVEALGEANEFGDTVAQVEVAEQVAAVVHELQRERTLTVTALAGSDGDVRAVDAQAATVDNAVRQLREVVAGKDLGDEETQRTFDRALQRLDALGALRDKIEDSRYPDLSAYTTYNSIVEPLVRLGRTVNLSVTDRELLRRGTTVQAIIEAKEYTSRQNAALGIAVGHNRFISDLLDRSTSAQASADAAVDTFIANAGLGEQQLYRDRVSGAEVDDRARQIAIAHNSATSPGGGIGVDANQLAQDGQATVDMMREVEGRLLVGLRESARSFATDATRAAWLFFGLMSATLVATVLLTLMVARALTGPLRTLRSSALEVAYVRLPETVRRILADPNPIEASRDAVAPVPVRTREEIGEVARSFDVVHERAIRLAAEQALLRENVNGIFVNLSRRSQRLVERQLGIIDRLESDEQDPDQLASLFELDHLATRLRRNGESLLVLSGAGLTKTMSKPVPAADVIGASVSEIEQYARVELGSVPEIRVHGRAVHDLVHLLAELLDNATYFSEPETKISVRAVVTRRKSLAVQITDRGVGMSNEQLTEANDRLADPPDLDVSVTRRMGLYVVARLAKRHGIEVRLRENEDIEGGVIARVVVPTELLTAPPGGADGAAQARGTWAETSEPSRPEVSSPSLPPVRDVSDSTPVPPLPAPRGSGDGAGHPELSFPGSAPLTGGLDGPVRAAPADRDDRRFEPTGHPRPEETGPAGPAHGDDHGGGRNGHSPAVPPSVRDFPAPEHPAPEPSAPKPFAQPPAPEQDDGDGLRPLDQPISLDDLVGGANRAAGPFVSPVTDEPEPEPATTLVRPVGTEPRPDPEEPQWPVESPDGDVDGDADGIPALPKRAPRAVPGVSAEESETAASDGAGSVLEDDVPTRRLPIYQSVLSRWFSEEAAFQPEHDDTGADAAPADAGTVAEEDFGAAARAADGADGDATGTAMTDYHDTTGHGEADTTESEWSSVSDTGWQAAHALLEDKNEEVTRAGLPKRVPNAYLVPGSVGGPSAAGSPAPSPNAGPSRGDGFTDTTVGEPGQGAIARSAETARNRMKSFQRGYQSGRHALGEPQTRSEQFDDTGATPRSNGAKE